MLRVPPRPGPSGLFKALAALFLAALVVSAGAMWNRHAYEKRSGRVILAVDGDEVAQAAERSGVSTSTVLRLLRSAGATAVGVHEYSLQDAVGDGRAFLLSPGGLDALLPQAGAALRAEPLGEASGRTASFLIGIATQTGDSWFLEAFRQSVPGDAHLVYDDGGVQLWQFPAGRSLANVILGFDPDELRTVQEAGFDIIPRLRPTEGRAWEQVQSAIEQLPVGSLAAIVFWGAEVTGYPESILEVAGEIRDLGGPIGLIEFSVQRGIDALAKALDYQAVRTHSITAEEIRAGIARDVALRRWERAVRERGVRLAYVRLYPDDPLEEAAAYVGAVAERLRGAGLTPGRVELPIEHAPSPIWALLWGAAVVGAAGGWLVRLVGFRPSGRNWMIAASIAVPSVFSLLWFKGYTVFARQSLALLAAVVVPSLAVLVGWEIARSRTESGSRLGGAFKTALLAFGASVALTLAGAMLVVLFLDDIRFLLGVTVFRGVKVAYIMPLAIVAIAQALAWGRGFAGERRPGWLGAKDWRTWLTTPVQLWQVLAAVGVVGLLAVYLLRSGNQGFPMVGVEASLRTLLEDAFVARPRTKEFLVGHPALLATYASAAYAVAARRPGPTPLTALLAIAGTVGPISIVNTFAHAHSPLALSGARTVYGLILGAMLGAAAVYGALRIARIDRVGLTRPPARGSRTSSHSVGPRSGP